VCPREIVFEGRNLCAAPASLQILAAAITSSAYYILSDPYANAFTGQWRPGSQLGTWHRIRGKQHMHHNHASASASLSSESSCIVIMHHHNDQHHHASLSCIIIMHQSHASSSFFKVMHHHHSSK
jgi:hypothetical protein